MAERDGSSFDDAVRTITFDDAESWGKLVVDVTEEHAAGRSVKD
ncbi:MAG: hypothetical protein Q7T56_07840 [Nocardioidaceae bacterium]|nr:hypothetical protein [Nocardioidaceae bacterium]